MNISVIGLGKLGSPLAAWIASKGHHVIGVDVNEAFVECVNGGVAPVLETGLDKLLQKVVKSGNLRATTDIQDAVLNSEMTFIIVPTPSGEDDRFELKYVGGAAEHVGLALSRKAGWHLVVIVSTVMPGDTDKIRSKLERLSGKECGEGFGLCYNPEFIALGSVLHDLENPDFVLIGESDTRSGLALSDFYYNALFKVYWDPNTRTRTEIAPNFQRMSFVSAELAKLSLNSYVTMKISFANQIARLCEQVGADADDVLGAIGQDSRIGTKYLKAGAPFGGPCFPRDNRALQSVVESAWLPLARATDDINEATLSLIAQAVYDCSCRGALVAILGTAYKPGTHVTEESPGEKLAKMLDGLREVISYDPMAPHTHDLEECMVADVVVVMLPCTEFEYLLYSTEMQPDVIIDPWNIVKNVLPGIWHIRIGRKG